MQRLTLRFGALTAVDAVSFTIARGRIFGLPGSNGAGKNTLVKMLTTRLPPRARRGSPRHRPSCRWATPPTGRSTPHPAG